ncbi:NAD(+) diphosphatase [Marilutibacter chinensis]|uniref:NAD(+) diphosphatase n=1 Tax=Marilutibacter chinensis TaxID=2912247 RepID=A0ABS9HY88_9GAMM|nr:NAD(+) diphosphatase [Lysobacter chinensis]MCF7223305.1 NAD(+) diphosphatase [Lysobacter chinensis]
MTDASPFAFVPTVPGELPAAVLDRADHLRDDNAALDALWNGARVLLLDSTGRALVDGERRPAAPQGAELSGGAGGSGMATFLGLTGAGQAWFSLDAELVAYTAAGTLDVRSAAALWPMQEAAVFAQARAMQHWHQRHRHCGSCGAQTRVERGGWLRRCSGCGIEHYPRTDPAVIVAVSDGERLLLGRQAGWPPRRYSVIAGFVEPGESLEQAVAREVEEETGLRISRCRYLASQPWPFPGTLMLGFFADATGEPRPGEELEDVRWFDADSIADARRREQEGGEDHGEELLLSPSISISRWLLEQWLAERQRAGS